MTVLSLVQEPEEEHPAPGCEAIRLVFGHDEYVAKWVQQRIPAAPDFGPCTAIGVADDNRLIAGVVYNNFHGYMVEVSMASIDPRWCNRRTMRALFKYPFEQLKVRRLQITMAKRDKKTRKLFERMGFKFEGTGRQAWPDGTDACVYSLLRHECRWLKETHDGKIITESPASC